MSTGTTSSVTNEYESKNDPRFIADTLLFEVEHLRRIVKEPA